MLPTRGKKRRSRARRGTSTACLNLSLELCLTWGADTRCHTRRGARAWRRAAGYGCCGCLPLATAVAAAAPGAAAGPGLGDSGLHLDGHLDLLLEHLAGRLRLVNLAEGLVDLI